MTHAENTAQTQKNSPYWSYLFDFSKFIVCGLVAGLGTHIPDLWKAYTDIKKLDAEENAFIVSTIKYYTDLKDSDRAVFAPQLALLMGDSKTIRADVAYPLACLFLKGTTGSRVARDDTVLLINQNSKKLNLKINNEDYQCDITSLLNPDEKLSNVQALPDMNKKTTYRSEKKSSDTILQDAIATNNSNFINLNLFIQIKSGVNADQVKSKISQQKISTVFDLQKNSIETIEKYTGPNEIRYFNQSDANDTLKLCDALRTDIKNLGCRFVPGYTVKPNTIELWVSDLN